MSQKLTEQQQAAVHALRGPVAIIAGAGTGKTHTITERIAHGVLTGTYRPERVMALSFTKKAAGELQSRLQQKAIVGVRSRTFHSAALQQLGYFWPATVGGVAPKILHSKIKLLGQLAQDIGANYRLETLQDIAAEIEWRKVSLLTLTEYEAALPGRQALTAIEGHALLDMMQRYESAKHKLQKIDFEDVLLLLTGMLMAEQKVADAVHEQYRFFTVDEYQDISALQHALLKAWLGERNDVCVVGDPAQTIYSFAGASSRFLRGFAGEFDAAQIFELDHNFRSTPEILQTANNLIKAESGALTLRAVRKSQSHVPSYEFFADETAEARAVAEAVQKKLRLGAKASQMAVLFRSHGYALQLETALRDLGIPIKMLAGPSYFELADVKRAILEIRSQAMSLDTRPPYEVVSSIIRGMGWSSKPPAGSHERERWEVLNALLNMADEMPAVTDIKTFSAELDRRANIDHEPDLEAVTLATLHGAKGLEWPLVWFIGATENVIPISYAQNQDSIAEERRLFYVGITRARDEIYFSGAGRKSGKSPSRFLHEAGVLPAQHL